MCTVSVIFPPKFQTLRLPSPHAVANVPVGVVDTSLTASGCPPISRIVVRSSQFTYHKVPDTVPTMPGGGGGEDTADFKISRPQDLL